LLVHGRWLSPGTSTSSTTKTGRHDIAEISLKVALQKDNQNLYIEEKQTTQWPKEKVQKDKQRSIKNTQTYESLS
jgi:hypothetical protein